ncbi:hypothetical protein DE146DRAFT_627466 [Phaeosphaeria sp. MPI-PUGE-AT-0046c]|nr:hypothetical protein DE146DRAFT_627466 [Phaeosphaeria sp. MPI-PUGE-AT-0046c]
MTETGTRHDSRRLQLRRPALGCPSVKVKLDKYQGAWKNCTRDTRSDAAYSSGLADKCGTTAVPACEAERGVMIRVCVKNPGRDGAPVLWVSPAHPPKPLTPGRSAWTAVAAGVRGCRRSIRPVWDFGEHKEGFTRRMYATRLRRSASSLPIRWRCVHRAVGLLRYGGGQRVRCSLLVATLGTAAAKNRPLEDPRSSQSCKNGHEEDMLPMDECHGHVELYRNQVFLQSSTFRVCFLPYSGCDMATLGQPAESDNQTAIANSLPSPPDLLRRRRRHGKLHVIPLQNLHRHPHRSAAVRPQRRAVAKRTASGKRQVLESSDHSHKTTLLANRGTTGG